MYSKRRGGKGSTSKGRVRRGEERRGGWGEEGMGGEKRLGEERGGEGKKRKTASGVHLLPAVTFFAGNPAGN